MANLNGSQFSLMSIGYSSRINGRKVEMSPGYVPICKEERPYILDLLEFGFAFGFV